MPREAGTEEDEGRGHEPGWSRCAAAEGREQGTRGSWREGQGNGKWSMPGFRVGPGGAVLVAGRYTVKAVQSQVML